MPGELLVRSRGGAQNSKLLGVLQPLGARITRSFPLIGWRLVSVHPGAEALLTARLTSAGFPVEPNRLWRAAVAPNDPEYWRQWALPKIAAPAAWARTTGSNNVVVAVVDSGIYYGHEDLANMWRNLAETPGNGVDDDLSGYVDDVYGIDAIADTGDPRDRDDHGTQVAGIVGAVGNNTKGIAGVNWSVKLMALRWMTRKVMPEGYLGRLDGATADAIQCLEYVARMKHRGVDIRVVNASWGDYTYSQALEDIVREIDGLDILTCCAAGNYGDDIDLHPFYPAVYSFRRLLSIASSTSTDSVAQHTNYGATKVHLAAPGVDIFSTTAQVQGYGYATGTSMATPHVTGAAALLAAQQPTINALQIKSRLLETVDTATGWAGKCSSGGRLNVGRAVTAP